ncbi:OB-fold domain-containing protein [Rhodococcus sp. CSLK01-03]|uniref:OB-fold domain-containing protein n=1 Tax=Rhodococcus indonesiensis TaxID=3055869 RepID=A0ABT7RVT9_9NOCA|nr:OB-fold domain-containing protein [Rhodococcus indonesiensis]MDM7491354.1 OB-fold domain-containing protein [Rhodococcus indonesiensis]
MSAGLARRGRETTRSGKLVIWKCRRCAALLAPLTGCCPSCGAGTLEPIASAGAGVIVSYRVVDRTQDPVCGEPCPSVMAIVALDEGPWVYSWIDGDVPVRSERPVRVRFRSAQPGERFPVFAPRDPD